MTVTKVKPARSLTHLDDPIMQIMSLPSPPPASLTWWWWAWWPRWWWVWWNAAARQAEADEAVEKVDVLRVRQRPERQNIFFI